MRIDLEGCTSRPLGSYLKSLGVLRLVSEQVDDGARGWWEGDCFHLESELGAGGLIRFLLEDYRPTPIVAPWNGGSGFYVKDRKAGIEAIIHSSSERFRDYRAAIEFLRGLPEIQNGKADKNGEEDRRVAILLAARNRLSDSAVEWLDAAIGIAADGKRSFAPVVGTGGNEGRLDYTNNFMERLAGLLIDPDKKTPVRELLEHSLFGRATEGLQLASVGQFDPGRAGGFNQGQGITTPDVPVNPWDFVLTLEGAVAWAGGLYRRQGIAYRSFLCSPFTVYASDVGYGSSAGGDAARAEVWTPMWHRPARYAELKVLLREGRASVEEQPAATGIEFAEAACSLGVDRGIDAFVRYSLLKRRGDSYIALPAGRFPVGYRAVSDRIRELRPILNRIDALRLPASAERLRRGVDGAIYEALLHGGAERLRAVMAALGELLRWFGRTGTPLHVPTELDGGRWIAECGSTVEVRIAAALASIYDRHAGGIRENLFAAAGSFAWTGCNLPDRMVSVLEKRLRVAEAAESDLNPFGAAYELHPGDATLFIEGSVDDDLIEDLLFAFTCLTWKGYRRGALREEAEVLPVYVVLKHLFLGSLVEAASGEGKRLRSDGRVISLLRAESVAEAADIALHRLRVAGLNPLEVQYESGVDAMRLAGSLLIPVRTGRSFGTAILRDREQE